MARIKIKPEFRLQLSEKLMDLGNLVVAALVFGERKKKDKTYHNKTKCKNRIDSAFSKLYSKFASPITFSSGHINYYIP